jgi:hypothetical protein
MCISKILSYFAGEKKYYELFRYFRIYRCLVIFVFVYEKEACFSVLGGLDKLPFLSGKG